MTKVAVIGGGGTGIAVAADLNMKGHSVVLFEQEDRAQNLRDIREKGTIELKGSGPVGITAAPRITFDPAEAVKGAEIIFMCMVANRHREMSALLAPHIVDGQTVCFFNGHCASLIMKNLLGNKKVLVGETLGTLAPNRLQGKGVVSFAAPIPLKPVAAFPARDGQAFAQSVSRFYESKAYPDVPFKNIFDVALSGPNASVHLAASLACISAIERKEDFRLYRDGLSPSVMKLIGCMQEEKKLICQLFGFQWSSVLGQMEACYNFDMEPDANVVLFRMTTGPTSVSHRYISEDAHATNALMVSIGRQFGLSIPVAEAAVSLASALNDTDFYKTGNTLENFGLTGYTVEQINDYLQTGVKRE